MNTRKKIFLALAIVLGLSTVLMMRSAMHKPTQSAGIEVLVATADIPSGAFLAQNNLRWQAWEPSHITEAFIRKNAPSASGSSNANDMIGAVARQGIRAGEPIMRGVVVKPQDRGFLSAVLEPGERAIAAPITNVTGIAGFVFPGDRVDLILTHSMRSSDNEAGGQRRASVTIVKNVRVLALDQNANDQNTNQPKVAKVVTLEVDPKQAEVVTLALQLGTLSLSLRSIAQDKDGKPLAEPVGYESAGRFTMDSDISNLIPAPRSKVNISTEMVRVLRGSNKTDTASFSNRTPDVDPSTLIDETKSNSAPAE
jgi:pilus assembly protein CpaB